MNPLFPMANISKRATFLYLSHLCGSRTVLPHRRVCFVVGIIPHFFSERALVHICIPQTYTPCGRKSLSGWSYSVTLRPRSSRCLPSFCIYYTTLSWVCQEVFEKFFQKVFPNCVQSLLTWVFPLGSKVAGMESSTFNLFSSP